MSLFGDWRDTRAAVEAAYKAMGLPVPASIPRHDWNLAGEAIKAYCEAQKVSCYECHGEPMTPHEWIRCFDCNGIVCRTCAPKHFWPNGRPKDIPNAQ